MDNLRCVAAPIFDCGGAVHYAVSASGLYSSMRGEPLTRAIQLVKQTAETISRLTGAGARNP